MLHLDQNWKDRLKKLVLTNSGYYYPDPQKRKLGSVFVNGLSIKNIPAHVEYALSYEQPQWFTDMQASASMIAASHPKYKDTANYHGDLFHEVLIDMSNTSRLRRLTQEQKDYCLDWIYHGCRKYGRNAHEQAVMVPHILGGYNNCNPYNPDPFEPKLGAIGKTWNILNTSATRFKQLGGYPEKTATQVVTQVLHAAGVPDAKVNALSHTNMMLDFHQVSKCAGNLKKYFNDLCTAIWDLDKDASRLEWDFEWFINATKNKWGHSTMEYQRSSMSSVSRYMMENKHLLDMDPTPLIDMQPQLLSDCARLLKRWDDRNV